MDTEPHESPQTNPTSLPSAAATTTTATTTTATATTATAPTTTATTITPKPAFQTPKNITIRHPPFSYLHLTLVSSTTNPPPLDILTARGHLTSALQQFLGVTGTAIPVDFLKVEGRDAWVRVPREDGPMVTAALSGWIGGDGVAWRILGSADWLGALVAGTGGHLFKR